jgi:hypothetical protein
VEDRTKIENEIKKAEQHEALKQTFLRLLDDPQIQQKIVTVLSRRLGQIPGANKGPADGREASHPTRSPFVGATGGVAAKAQNIRSEARSVKVCGRARRGEPGTDGLGLVSTSSEVS